MTTKMKCFYCEQECVNFANIIGHLLEHHPEKEIKFIKHEDNKMKHVTFKVIPELCREQGRIITLNEEENKIHVSRSNLMPKDSPLKKITKLEPSQSESYTQFGEEPLIIEEHSEHDSIYEELVSLLPGVLDTLKSCYKTDEYLAFNRLLNDKKFPVTNIAFLLFLDVVRWLSLEKSTTFMRYSNDVKLFWQTGLRLFHGRFLRYMSGPKNQGQIINSDTSPGQFNSQESKINFAVPDRRVLHDEEKIITDNKPGIFYSMIDSVSRADPDQRMTYKLCVDGKKINPCSSGEVDLWGYENEPTYEQKQKRLNEEINFLEKIQKQTERLIQFSHTSVLDLASDDKVDLVQKCHKTISIVSERIKDLRHLKLNKEVVLKKLQSKIEGDWKSSQFAMVISSIRTALVHIELCIDGFLTCNEKLCEHIARMHNTTKYLRSSSEVYLQTQGNLVCLADSESTDDNLPAYTKQRSDKWFQIRKTSLVTGSTINTAVGLESLKKQREHLEIASGKVVPPKVSEDLQGMFDYGITNEVNAVATFVSSFLPSFCPEGMFYEEGCYTEENDGKVVLVVSPDGSIRHCNDSSNVLFGVEIKCPMPNKTYTTPVHYTIPRYYIPQILSEMNALKVNRLFYLSYSQESMTVHVAEFDEQLWSDILTEVESLDLDHLPKRKTLTVESLKSRIEMYRKQKVKLIAEIKSKRARACDHTYSTHFENRYYHENDNGPGQNKDCDNSLKEILKTCIRCKDLITDCHRLCVQRASEVMVFLVSDLDRTYKAEKVHAYPIAYGLRGYSVKSDSIRKIIQRVLNALFMSGMYTPAVSYDGEWGPLAFKTEHGKPLTLLELQRTVYNDVKKLSKADIVRKIAETAVVKADNFTDLVEQIDYKESVDDRAKVYLGVRDGTKLFFVSKQMESFLKSSASTQKSQDKEVVSDSASTGVDTVFSTISPEILGRLENDVIKSVSTVNNERPCVESGSKATVLDSDAIANMFDTEDVTVSHDVDDLPIDNCEKDTMEVNQAYNFLTENTQGIEDELSDVAPDSALGLEDVRVMFNALKTSEHFQNKWLNKDFDNFFDILKDSAILKSEMTKKELLICLESVKPKLTSSKVLFSKSWNKQKLTEFIRKALSAKLEDMLGKRRRKKTFTPTKLSVLCKRKVSGFTKVALNAIMAEHQFPERYRLWAEESPFTPTTSIHNIGNVTWFSRPEYNSETLSYIFSFLDVHHLVTNCRVKVCKDGFPQRQIKKQAWLAVAKENTTRLKIAHVEDLLDKQSGSIARETFSKDVEIEMLRLGYESESKFCKLIREFHEAEDEPGISAVERCERRLRLRDWLLDGVNFGSFPPSGFYVRGIPHVMFQGFLTNIERRIQIVPYVKSGSYNARTLGSLEAENLFGEFQDLDPKGSGVIKAEDIPAALESACQLQKTRLKPDRLFHMSLSQAKVYPNQELMDQGVSPNSDGIFFYPTLTTDIEMKDHEFDAPTRARRSAKRRLVKISAPDEAARGAKPIRQVGGYKVNESRLLDSQRANLELK